MENLEKSEWLFVFKMHFDELIQLAGRIIDSRCNMFENMYSILTLFIQPDYLTVVRSFAFP